VLDQLAKYERAKFAERSRRGKLRRAREGKILPTYRPDFGFGYNVERTNYVVKPEEMALVRRIIRMVGVEGATIHGVKRTSSTRASPHPRECATEASTSSAAASGTTPTKPTPSRR
jgi:site-specific DNA recombinase